MSGFFLPNKAKINMEILKYQDSYRKQILEVWEASVLATHDFLDPKDFEEIKKLVQTIDFNHFQVYCLLQEEEVLGFLGVAERKIEMLFLHPSITGRGWGKKMINFAIEELKADTVDVNEQNTGALAFYKKMGFKVISRSDQDDQGKDYPILKMKLEL